MTAVASELQAGVANTFQPSAVKFRYIFNPRDITDVFGGLCRSEPHFYSDKVMKHFSGNVSNLKPTESKVSSMMLSSFNPDEDNELIIFPSFCTNTGDNSLPHLPVKD